MNRAFVLVACLACACGPATLGRPLVPSPRDKIRLGVDTRSTVLAAFGSPQRRFADPDGREVFVYLWADGYGFGDKYLVAFNSEGIAYLVEAVR